LIVASIRVRSSLEMARASSNGADGLRPLQLAARLAITSGRHHHAVRILAAVAGWLDRHAVPPVTTLWARWALPGDDEAVAVVRAALGESAFATAWAEGFSLSLDDALDEALAAASPEHDPAPPGC
jgi:hypothetical protein